MNQEQNNLNLNNFNTEGNNGVPNNQPLSNQRTNADNSEFMQQSSWNGSSNSQQCSTKLSKKKIGLIIGIIVAVIIVMSIRLALYDRYLNPNNLELNNNGYIDNENAEKENLTEEEMVEKLKEEYKIDSRVKFSARLGKIKYGYQTLEIDITNNSKNDIKRVDFYVVTYDSNKNQISKGYMASDTILNAGKTKNGQWNLVGENIDSFDLYVWGIQFEDGSIWGKDSLNEDILVQCALKIV